jgi:hypothetical protein
MYLFGLPLAEKDEYTAAQSELTVGHEQEVYEKLLWEVTSLHDLLYEPNEKTVTLRIKGLVAMGDPAGAEAVLNGLPDKATNRPDSQNWKRLRTFLPILSFYCQDPVDTESSLRVFRQMCDSDGVFLDSETYALLISSLASRGCFDFDATPIPGAVGLGFTSGCGPQLFDEIVSKMADDLLELTEQSADRIFKAFMARFSDAPSLALNESSWTVNGDIICGRVTVNGSSGICPATGARLRLFALDEVQRAHVHDQLLDMAATQHEDFGEKFKEVAPRDGQYAFAELSKFSSWFRNQTDPPFTAIIDGPNVAYWGHGDIHYSQVYAIYEELEKMGERPLVIMPQKYAAPRFWLSSLGRVQELSAPDLEIMDKLVEAGNMYIVPKACLDDYYWMISSVANKAAQHDSDGTTTPSNLGTQMPGLRPILVTNDQMRDHKLELLEPRLFRRWTSCHIVNYNLHPYEQNEWETRRIEFSPADAFSREIQGNPATTHTGATAWHFPVDEWGHHDRLCVLLRAK